MSPDDLKHKISIRVTECLRIVESKIGQSFELPEIRLNLKGYQAGQAIPGHWLLRFNAPMAKQDPERFVYEVSAHEVAHLVTYRVWQTLDHGPDFKKVMNWLNVDASRSHNFEAQPSRKIRRYKYFCACSTHNLSSIRHNRISKGQVYKCVKCGDALSPIYTKKM